MALFVRVILIIVFNNWEPISDFGWYYKQAINFANFNDFVNTNGTSTAFWPIGYPFILGLFFKLFGESILITQFINILFNLLSIYLFYQILNKLMPEHQKINVIFTTIYAFYPDNIAFNVISSPEIVFVTLLLLSYYLFLNDNKKNIFLMGIVIGIATIIRPQAVLIPVIFLCIRLFEHRSISKFFSYLILTYLGIFIVITPVIYRNYKIFDNFVFISNNSGINLHIAHHEGANGRYKMTKFLDSLYQLNFNEYEKDQLAKQEAIKFLKTKPFSIIQNIPKKIIGYFGYVSGFNWINEGLTSKMNKIVWTLLMGISNLYYYLILILFVFVIFKKQKYYNNSILPLSVIFYFVILHTIIFFGSPKYNQTIIPFILIYIAINKENIFIKIKDKIELYLKRIKSSIT